jgi:hypothetical protein
MADTSKTYFKPLPAYQLEIIKEMGFSLERRTIKEILEREKVYVQKMNEARLRLGIKTDSESDSDSDSDSELDLYGELKEDKKKKLLAPILDFKNVKCFKDFKEFVLKLKKAETINSSATTA